VKGGAAPWLKGFRAGTPEDAAQGYRPTRSIAVQARRLEFGPDYYWTTTVAPILTRS
jgi:hypothetical protein